MVNTTCVINVHNGENYIRSTLDSVLAQISPVRILIINNRSTDSTEDIILSYSSRYTSISIVNTDQLLDLGSARNFSIKYVTTKYMAWLDADDLWEKDYTLINESVLESEQFISFVSSNVYAIDQNGLKIIKRIDPRDLLFFKNIKMANDLVPLYYNDTLDRILNRNHLTAGWSSYFFRTNDLLKVGGLDSRFKFAEDYDLICRLLVNGNGLHICKKLSCARFHSDRTTTNIDPMVIYSEMGFIFYKYHIGSLLRYVLLRQLLNVKFLYWIVWKSKYPIKFKNLKWCAFDILICALILMKVCNRSAHQKF